MDKKLVVFGSVNLDFMTNVSAHPVPGETVLGSDFSKLPGGKGANQALAAAQHVGDGAAVLMAGSVGEDEFAELALANLKHADVDLHAVTRSRRETGVAFITVAQSGENVIVVSPGANKDANVSQLDAIVLADGDVLLTQQEIPLQEIWRAHAAARSAGCTVVHNAAPATSMNAEALAHIDILIVNETEAVTIGGLLDWDADDPETVCRDVRASFGTAVILTKGAEGAVLFDGDEAMRFPAKEVAVKDTTGAGDVFCGTLAAALVQQRPMESAVSDAIAAASHACTMFGAQNRL